MPTATPRPRGGDAGAGGLVGRRRQLAAMAAAAGRAQAGEPQVVLVGGEAGVGKTRLLHVAADRLEAAGARVLRTTCVELGAFGLPLVPVTAAVRQVVGSLGVEELRRTMPGADFLLGLLPEYGAGTSERDRLAEAGELFAALLQRLGADRLVVLCVDDLHRADRSSLALLGFLAQTLRASRVLVLLAYRADELGPDDPLRPFLAELARLPSVHRVELGRFNRAETAELVAGVPGVRTSAALVGRIYRRSGGNPFSALELARAGDPAVLPETLRDLLLQRATGLPERARQVVRVAATADRSISHRLLAAVAGVEEDELLAAVRGAVDARILVPDGDGYAFAHPLVREAVLEGLLPVERARLHREVAQALEADPGLVAADRHPAELAFHWQEAGEAVRALPALLDAADQAGRLSAHAERAQLLARAARLWHQVPEEQRPAGTGLVELLEQAVTAAGWAGDPEQALELVERALAAADPVRDSERVAMLLAHRSLALHHLGRDGATEAVEASLAALPDAPTAGRARALDLLAVVLVMGGRRDQAGRLAREAAAVAGRLGDDRLALNAQATLGWALAGAGAFRDALAVLGDAAELAEAHASPTQRARVQLNAARAWQGLGDYAAAAEAIRAGIDTAAQAGLARGLGAAASVELARVLTATGAWDEADAVAAGGLEVGPSDAIAAALHAARAELALRRGDPGLAREQLSLAQALSGAEATPSPWALPVVRAAAELALAENRVEDARAGLAPVLPLLAHPGDPLATWELLGTAARVERLAGLRAAALSEPGDPATAGRLAAVAACLPADGPELRAHARWVAAELGDAAAWAPLAADWDRIGQPFPAAYARLRAAEVAVAGGGQRAARELLDAAAATATRLGARPLLEEVRWLARQAGLGLAAETGPGGDDDLRRLGLTDREVEVLRQVTDGRSNRQIGERLFISPKTVSVHVSSILAKLGVASRGEAAATAHRLRLFDADGRDRAGGGAR